MSGRRRGRLVLHSCKSIDVAHKVFGERGKNGEKRLVLVPKRRFFRWFVPVPDGMTALVFKSGKFHKEMTSGGKCYLPPFTRVQYLITNQHTVFDAPVKHCFTADNIPVTLDVLLVFHIFDGKEFVFKLGPEKLDDYLVALTEEALRILCRSVEYKDVYTLTGRVARDMVRGINDKLKEFGVEVTSITITNVDLPDGIAHALQQATLFRMLREEQAMAQKYNMLVLNDTQKLKEREVEVANRIKVADLLAKILRSKIQKTIDSIKCGKNLDVSLLNAEEDTKVAAITEKGALDACKFTTQMNREVVEMFATMADEIAELDAKTDTFGKLVISVAEVERARLRYKGMLREAEAEKVAAKKLSALRDYRLKLEKLVLLHGIATNDETIVAGDSGVIANRPLQDDPSGYARDRAMDHIEDVIYGRTKHQAWAHLRRRDNDYTRVMGESLSSIHTLFRPMHSQPAVLQRRC
eukprot:TRINITY_DN2574_c0_g1_i1.p1 TRINITY_DN2574_c0_g1~~TRINITY_DN2574_c0_g1_i1.p1  ORF type:complete len:467 (+),score=96.67 TRINITY_DN2574_c0_g1_i1:76-1476(+)